MEEFWIPAFAGAVMPAEAGIQPVAEPSIPAVAGMTLQGPDREVP